MKLVFIDPLKQKALAKVAITLWSQNDIRDLMSKSALHMLHNDWQVIEKAVIEKSFKLQLPSIVKKNISYCIVRVGWQILSWVRFHHCNYNFVTELPATFVWTSSGTINNIMTAKQLVMSGTLDDDMSFALACMYCLEDEIKYCWNKIGWPEEKWDDICFVQHWTRYMYSFHMEKLSPEYLSMMNPTLGFVIEAARNGNEAAIRYYFKVSTFNYSDIIVSVKAVALELNNCAKVTSLQRYSSVMLFLLSELNVDQQAQMIVNFTHAILKCLLIWPWHSLFLKVSKDKWNSLSKKHYKDLLNTMVVLMRFEHNLHQLFGEFWQQSPDAYKQFIIEQDDFESLLIGLYKREDEKNVKLIIGDLSISPKEIIFKESVFQDLVALKLCDSVTVSLKKYISSQEDFMRLTDKFINCFFSKFKFSIKSELVNFGMVVDDLILKYNRQKTITHHPRND